MFWFFSVVWLLLVSSASAFYDPGLQRWINRDPVGEAAGPNIFAFVDNDPAAWVDNYGLNKVTYCIRRIGEFGRGLWDKVAKKKAREKLLDETHDVLVEGPGASKEAKNLAKERWGDGTTRHDPHAPGQRPHYQNRNGDGQHVFYGCANAAIECSPIGDVKDIYKTAKEAKDLTKESLNAMGSTMDAQAKMNNFLNSCDDLSEDETENYMRYRFGGKRK